MIYLFLHQNFPGQYRHVVRMLADRGDTVYFISQPNKNAMAGVHKIHYTVQHPQAYNGHPLSGEIDRAIRAGYAVAEVCKMLKNQGVQPDLVIGHCGWGETLFIKDVFPDTPVLAYFEFFYKLKGADLDFDPEFSSVFSTHSRIRTRNAISLMAFEGADWGHTPTEWQRSLHPSDMRRRISVLHEGVDTDVVRPDPAATFTVPGRNLKLSRKDEVITYVARNLEPYRGFHIFMRALPQLLKRRPKAQVLIVGGDGVSYGSAAAPRSTYREFMLEELGKDLPRERVHFLGQIDYDSYLRVLQISTVHTYLTYPFILSWSCIEALAAGCLVVGSKTAPVQEVIEDGVNGLLVDFFSPQKLAEKIESAIRHKDQMQKLRDAARKSAVSGFDLKTRMLPQWSALLKDVLSGRTPRESYLSVTAAKKKKRN